MRLDRARRLQLTHLPMQSLVLALNSKEAVSFKVGKNRDTRAVPPVDPNNRLEHMKAIVQTADVERETISLREVIPFWFAVSSPLLGALLGAWFVAWVST
jgi:hypothetical protein